MIQNNNQPLFTEGMKQALVGTIQDELTRRGFPQLTLTLEESEGKLDLTSDKFQVVPAICNGAEIFTAKSRLKLEKEDSEENSDSIVYYLELRISPKKFGYRKISSTVSSKGIKDVVHCFANGGHNSLPLFSIDGFFNIENNKTTHFYYTIVNNNS